MSTKNLLFLCVGMVLAKSVLVSLLPVMMPLDIQTSIHEASEDNGISFILKRQTSGRNFVPATDLERESGRHEENSGQEILSQASPSAFPRLAEYLAHSHLSTPPDIPPAFPDGLLPRQPLPLSMEERVQLTKEFLRRYDEDPSMFGIVKGENGKVYPLYPNTIYVCRRQFVDENGDVFRTASTFGTVILPKDDIIPAGVRVVELDYETGDTIREYVASGEENIDGVNISNQIAKYMESIDSSAFPDSTAIDVDQKAAKGFNTQKPAGESQRSKTEPMQYPILDDSTRRSLLRSLTGKKPLNLSIDKYGEWVERHMSEKLPAEELKTLQQAHERAARQMEQARQEMSKDTGKRTEKKP